MIFCWQLEASIKNGDIQGFQLFSEAGKHLSSMTGKTDTVKGHHGTSRRKGEENTSLPPSQEQSGNSIRPSKEPERLSEGEDDRTQW